LFPLYALGAKITCDSATLMNKALEVIEAHYLYGTSYDNIDVVGGEWGREGGFQGLVRARLFCVLCHPGRRIGVYGP
jgi:hypothetical protein